MTRDEHKTITDQLFALATPEQQADVTRLLTQITEGFGQALTDNETLTKQNHTLTENNENLRAVNTELFLKVGSKAPQEKPAPEPGVDNPPMDYNALFNEKGELI